MGITYSATPASVIVDSAVDDAINNGVTTIAPSQNAVFDALALKAPLASPTFTGQILTAAGSSETPAISPVGDPTSGLWWNGSDLIYDNGPTAVIQFTNNGIFLSNGKYIRFYDGGLNEINLKAPNSITTYNMTLPAAKPTADGQAIVGTNANPSVLSFVNIVDGAYTPTTSGDWPVQPTTIKDALDKLAARLNVLEP